MILLPMCFNQFGFLSIIIIFVHNYLSMNINNLLFRLFFVFFQFHQYLLKNLKKFIYNKFKFSFLLKIQKIS